jgi:DNA-binding SARP family transcriptional activator/predicted ATPase
MLMDAELRLELLGTSRISLGGRPVKLVRRRSEALLVYLAISGRPHTRDSLAMLLAGETDDQRARKHLRTALAEVTATLGGYLIATTRTIAFNRDRPHWIDVKAFEEALAVPGDLQRIEEAVALYRDEFMTSFALPDALAFDDWLLLERERLRDQLILGLQSLLIWHIRRRDFTAGSACANRLLALEPWNEEAHRGLMRLLAQAGQRTAALAQYETCRHTLAEELGVEPTPETNLLFQRLRDAPMSAPHNLPAQTTSFVGHTETLAELHCRLTDPRNRLICIHGLGGTGKTRLALEAAKMLAAPSAGFHDSGFPDGIFLVGLQPPPAGAEYSVMAAIAVACGLTLEERRGPRQQILAWLAERAVLLILDCGDAAPPDAELLQAILGGAPRATILITSRTRLHLQGEWSLELPGLPVPANAAEVPHAPASQLFLQHAGRVDFTSRIAEDEFPAIVQICQLLDGFPIALIAAAQWLRSLSCATLYEGLAAGLDLLTNTLQDLPERQRSMRGLLAHTAATLGNDEQAVLRRLAVFAGPFDQEMAAAIAAATPLQLLALRDSALLARDDHGRYRLSPLVRLYAAEQLAARPFEAAQARTRHAAHFAGIATRYSVAIQDLDLHERMVAILDDVRVAWRWSAEHVAVDLLADLGTFLVLWYEMAGRYRDWDGDFSDAIVPVRAALTAARIPGEDLQTALGLLLTGRARALQHLGQASESLNLLAEASELLNTAGPIWKARVGIAIGRSLHMLGEFDAARERFDAALTMATTAEPDDSEAQLFASLGMLALEEGDTARAATLCDRAFAIVQAQGDRIGLATVTLHLGAVARDQGDFPGARYQYNRSLDLARTLRHRSLEVAALGSLAELAGESPYPLDESLALCSDAAQLARAIGDRAAETAAFTALGQLALVIGDLDRAHDTFAEALANGAEVAGLGEASGALRGLGIVAFHRGNQQEARDLALRSLAIARRHRQRDVEQGALLLGHIRLALADLVGAAGAYEEARSAARSSPAIDAEAGLARVDLARGDEKRSLARVGGILPLLQLGTPVSVEEPVRVYLACYRTLVACDDPRAPQLLAAGHAWLHERAVAIYDPDERQRFLQVPPAHRELMGTWRASLQSGADVIALPLPLTLPEHVAVS